MSAACSTSVPTRPLTPDAHDTELVSAGTACQPTDVSTIDFGLLVLGSGGGPRTLGRAGSSYVVVVRGIPRILVDVGPGTFLRLGELGIDLRALDIVLLTHLHIDHSGDLPGFTLARAVTGNAPMTFRIVGPTGADSYPDTTGFVELLFGDHGAFAYAPNFTHNRLQFDVTDLPATLASDSLAVMEDDGLIVSAISVDHRNVPAIAYRVDYQDRALVISGDLASKNNNLVRLAMGSDLLVYDTAVMDPPGSTKPLYELHTAPSRIGEIAAQSGARSLLLSHVTGRVADHAEEVMRSVRTGFNGQVRFAHDCMVVELGGR